MKYAWNRNQNATKQCKKQFTGLNDGQTSLDAKKLISYAPKGMLVKNIIKILVRCSKGKKNNSRFSIWYVLSKIIDCIKGKNDRTVLFLNTA